LQGQILSICQTRLETLLVEWWKHFLFLVASLQPYYYFSFLSSFPSYTSFQVACHPLSQKPFDFIPFHAQTIALAIPASREQIAAIDCSFINKSGKQTWGLDFFYNGSHSKAEKGLEISVISVIDVETRQGYTLSVQQTPANEQKVIKTQNQSKQKKKELMSARMKVYIDQVVQARPHLPESVKYLAGDGFYSKKGFVDGVRGQSLHLIGKLRIDANMRYLYTGAQKARGARRKYDGKVDLNDLSRLDYICEVDENIHLYSKILWHVSLKRRIRIAYLVNCQNPDKILVALLFSTDTEISPECLYAYYKARFQIEFIFRDAKQFMGLSDCQSRNKSSLDFHFNVSLAALNIAKLDQLQANKPFEEDDVQPISCSMATYKRQALNEHLLERFICMLDLEPTLIKSHPNYGSLLQYGSLTP
jgi:Transposase DDE domain